MRRFTGIFLFLVFCLTGWIVLSSAADEFSSPLSVEIKVAKAVFEVGETVDGTVIVRNTYPSALPATFNVELSQDNQPKYAVTTAVKTVFPGDNKFSFKNFGVPEIGRDKGDIGHWELSISQKDVDASYGAQARFRVVEHVEDQDSGGKDADAGASEDSGSSLGK